MSQFCEHFVVVLYDMYSVCLPLLLVLTRAVLTTDCLFVNGVAQKVIYFYESHEAQCATRIHLLIRVLYKLFVCLLSFLTYRRPYLLLSFLICFVKNRRILLPDRRLLQVTGDQT